MSAIELSSYAGLAALTLLTLNIVLGLLLTTKYNPVRDWPRRRINTFKIHRFTGYTALVVATLHPFLLLFSATAGFVVSDILFPLDAPKQPLINCMGALALYAVLVVAATSYFRKELGRRRWKALHFTSYGAAVLFFLHGLLTDPNLKDAPFDPFDAEKVYVESCLLVVMVGIVLRIRWQRRQPPPRQHLPKPPMRAPRSGRN